MSCPKYCCHVSRGVQLQLRVRVINNLETSNITYPNNLSPHFEGKNKVTSRNLAGVTRALAWVKLGGVYVNVFCACTLRVRVLYCRC